MKLQAYRYLQLIAWLFALLAGAALLFEVFLESAESKSSVLYYQLFMLALIFHNFSLHLRLRGQGKEEQA